MAKARANWLRPKVRQDVYVASVTCILLAFVNGSWNRAYGQAKSAVLNGIIVDVSEAVVPGVQIVVISEETGVRRETQTNSFGFFAVQPLIPGHYRVEIAHAGFKKVVKAGLVLEADRTFRVDTVLQLGDTTQHVEVTAPLQVLQLDSSDISMVTTSSETMRLPDLSRTPHETLLFSTNAAAVSTPCSGCSGVIMAGSTRDGFGVAVDGQQGNMRGDTNQIIANLMLNEEGVSEVTILAGAYSAEYHGTGVISLTSKSGTNNYHGSAYWYNQNDALNAAPWGTSGKKVPFNFNTGGFSVGGPIKKEKTYFFGNYEVTRSTSPITVSGTVPTLAQRNGDFSGRSPIYDPLTAAPCPNNPAVYCRSQFPGNLIPANRIDPVARAILPYVIQPNQGNPNAFVSQISTINNTGQTSARVDHQFNSRSKLFVRYSRIPVVTKTGGVNKNAPGSDPYAEDRNPGGTAHDVGVGYDFSITPTFLSQTYFKYTDSLFLDLDPGRSAGYAGLIGLKGVDPDAGFPRINISGYQSVGGVPWVSVSRFFQKGYHFSQKFTYVHGTHDIRLGLDISRSAPVYHYEQNPEGTLSFSPITPRTDMGGGDAFASFLLGFVSSGSVNLQAPDRNFTTYYFAPWVQDDWRVRPTFTLNMGLRWEMDTPTTYQHQILSGFNPYATNPVSGTPGAVTFTSLGTYPGYVLAGHYKDVSPRLGFAWQPFGSHSRTVIRGGGAIIFEPSMQEDSTDFQLPVAGDGINFSLTGDSLGLTPAFSLTDGFPPPVAQQKGPRFGAVEVGQRPNYTATYWQPNDPFPRMYKFDFTVQHELPGQILTSVGYLGTLGRHLRYNTANTNEVPINQAGPGEAQIRRPFPQFGDVDQYGAAVLNSSYHGLEMTAQKHFSSGYQFKADYVWSKMLDDRNGFRSWFYQNLNKGPGTGDQRHRFVFSGAYELPVGSGKRLMQSGPASRILGGWTAGTIITLETGLPLQISNALGNTCNCFANQGVDLVGNPLSDGGSMKQWFNTSAFAVPAPYHFGTAGPGLIHAPGQRAFDLAVWKHIRITEGTQMSFRAQMINLLNHSNLNAPVTAFGNPNFGKILTKSGNRQIELGLRFQF